jgi:hypothetical protein
VASHGRQSTIKKRIPATRSHCGDGDRWFWVWKCAWSDFKQSLVVEVLTVEPRPAVKFKSVDFPIFILNGVRRSLPASSIGAATPVQHEAGNLEVVPRPNRPPGDRNSFSTARVLISVIQVVDLLVPELQRRNRFRTSYGHDTLKENLADS